MKKIISVVGARPNFMKMAPVHKAIKKFKDENGDSNIEHLICHTGQHYDEKMSKVFFDDLELPKPDFYLGVGSGSHAEQTARIMIEFEKILLQSKPDLVIVYGDVNSTVACALTAVKLDIKVAHVEAGLRSGDRTMPEEINRLLTDVISDYLFVSEPSGIVNLQKEGIPDEKIFYVGNTMIDSLIEYLPQTAESNIYRKIGLKGRNIPYILLTLHRPSNVDNKEYITELINLLVKLSHKMKIIFPVHPRTKKNFESWNVFEGLGDNVIITEPLPYIDFITLAKDAHLILTDSGGIQEETTYLGVPCLTLRENTERPVTVTLGTNILVGVDLQIIEKAVENILNGKAKKGSIPELWDGKSADRIAEIIMKIFAIDDTSDRTFSIVKDIIN